MHEHELWQVFTQNGLPVDGRGEIDAAFSTDDTLVMGNAHVWFWCEGVDGREVLLQKRSMSRTRSPGKYHISAAGHINVGETSQQAAIREAEEEMGVVVDLAKLYFVRTGRSGTGGRSINTVFVYPVDKTTDFVFNDGEVDSVKWVTLDEFIKMTHAADSHDLLDGGRAYFDDVINAIKQQ